MAGYKETPRQKMISMMYLVLYALLALNVSKEVLNAFIVVNESMESTNVSTAAKIDDAYAKFKLQNQLNPEKVGPYFKQAEVIRANAEKLIQYIDTLKLELVKVSERKPIDEIMQLYYKDTIINGEKTKYLMLEKVETKDKYDATTHYMVGTGDKPGVGEAYVLSKKMHDYRQLILKTMNLPDNSRKVGLITNEPGTVYKDKDGQKQDWEQHNFYFTILAADITILNRIIGEVQTAEYNAMNYLYGSVSETDFKFNKVAAKVIPRSTYVLQGQQYQADVLVAAYDEKTKITIKVLPGADTLTPKNEKKAMVIEGQAGMGKLEFPAKKVGLQKYAGVIEMIDPKTNKLKPYHFKGAYIVAPPALTVAPLKMNVLYIGIDNPVSISAAGIPDEKIRPSIDLGTLKRGPEGKDWIVRINKAPKGVRKAYISATAKILNKELPLGKVEFRVKRVPTPTAQIAGQSDGQIDKNRLLAAGAIIPNMRDFEFEVYYQVTGYTFGTIINGDYIPKNVKGNRFTKEIVNIIKNGKRKQKFFFDNIRAKGPDGTIRSLNPISLELK